MKQWIAAIVSFAFVSHPLLAENSKELLYEQACKQGIVSAQNSLPKTPDAEHMYQRGVNSCAGSRNRLKQSGELDREPNVVEFACGYSVGAMYAKYGFGAEVQPKPSARVLAAMKDCMSGVASTTKAPSK